MRHCRSILVSIVAFLLAIPSIAQGFTLNPGDILISNHSGNNVQRLEPGSGTVTTLTTVPGTPIGLAFDPVGNLYINVNSGIMKLDKVTGVLSTFFSGNGNREGLAFDPGTQHFFSVSFGANLIEEVDLGGNLVRTITIPGSTQLIGPAARGTDLIVSDYGSGRIYLGTTTGSSFTAIGTLTPGATYAVDEDAAGNIYANDFALGKVVKFTPIGGGLYTPSDFITGLGCPANGLSIGDDGSFTLSEFCENAVSIWNSDGSPRSTFPGVQSPDELVVFAPVRSGGDCLTLTFETEDDLATPLGNGQTLTTPPEFGLLVRVSAAGPNLGMTTFDSTPGGPNSGTSDDDMLIDRGNIVMLQDSSHPAQTVPGFWDTPLDDPDGGDLIFDLVTPAEVQSVVLIDLDPAPNLGASVTLTDSGNLTRVYTVPAGWTGTFHSAPGWKTLDLTTLADQVGNAPGFRLATASEMAGFDGFDVSRVVVHMTGRGAMDDLKVCSPSRLLASALPRNGSGSNHVTLANTSLPVIGQTWAADLDCTGFGNGLAILSVRSLAIPGIPTPFGERLIGGLVLHQETRVSSGSSNPFTLHIPNIPALVGLRIHAQGLCESTSTAGGKLHGVRGGLSNALDLVLGF